MRTSHANAGFSLIELAIVLLIVGTLMSGVLVAVSQSMANTRITDARAQLREIEEALYGYAQATGELPCPATDDSTNPGFAESPCDDAHGFVPSGTLGIAGPVNSDGLLIDPWGNPIRYSVIAIAATGTPAFTDDTSIQNFFNAGSSLTNANMFSICDDSTCTGTLYDTIPAVVMSLGPNGSTYTSADETLNAGTQTMNGHAVKANTDLDFVSATYSEDNFDDQLTWLSPYILFNRMVAAGKLP